MKLAMKSGNQAKLSVIRLLRAAIKNREIEKGRANPLTDQDVLQLVVSSIKQRQDAIELFRQGQRDDLVTKETHEIEILQGFLPQAMSADELRALARGAIAESGASGPKDMGRVMKLLLPKVVGRIDGAVVSQVGRELLSQT